MDTHTAVTATLLLCLILLIAVYYLGFSTGRALRAGGGPRPGAHARGGRKK